MRDDGATDRGPDEPGRVRDRRVQGDRVPDIVPARHHVGDEGLADRNVQGADDPEERADRDEVPDGDDAREREPGQAERQRHREALRDDEDPVAAPPVAEAPRDGHQEQGRELARGGEDAEEERRAGQPVGEPPHGHLLDPRTDK